MSDTAIRRAAEAERRRIQAQRAALTEQLRERIGQGRSCLHAIETCIDNRAWLPMDSMVNRLALTATELARLTGQASALEEAEAALTMVLATVDTVRA